MKIAVIGAGIFGVTIALELSKDHAVTLIDMNSDILQNASKVNHSRLHYGFHYPRSRATAVQCLEGYAMFYDYFKDAITHEFKNYYMIEKNSKVCSDNYEQFCYDMHLRYKNQYPKLDIDFGNIESSYIVDEPIFDYDLIKSRLDSELRRSTIKIILNKKILNKKDLEDYHVIINTTYFNTNKIKKIFDLPQTKLRFQTVIIPIFKYNHKKIGLTIMDGKYCSIMPKGFNPNTFLLYHAKESVIYETESEVIPKVWYYGKELIKISFLRENVYDKIIVKHHIDTIVSESQKYFRFLKNCEFVDYWQTVRALPINNDDERLSIFEISEQKNQKIISVLSGKISTCILIAKNINKVI
jgi:hypothetical protein